MEHYCYSLLLPKSAAIGFVPSLQLKPSAPRSWLKLRPLRFGSGSGRGSLSTIVASAGASHCDFSTPHQPSSLVGRFLAGVLLNQRQLFHVAVAGELKLLSRERDATVQRLLLSSDEDEACLHRRIAQMKHRECQVAIEDVMYVLILSKFSDIRVPLVPELSKCIYNGRLELWPSKDWELESIYDFEVLEMVKQHVSTVIGLRVNSSVTDNWATTKIPRAHLGRFYASSVLYGYFLKSATLRHHLEQKLAPAHRDLYIGHKTSLKFPEMLPSGYKNPVVGQRSASLGGGPTSRKEAKSEELRGYVLGFDPETLQRCAKVKSKEAANLIAIHCSALFGDDKSALETDETVLTSFSSLKRLALEAVAFGSFLWDTEDYVGTMYTLEENV